MELLQLTKSAITGEDRGVSPVIGVILMVAITVILAAVIATFVLGLGDSLGNQAPQASFDFDIENDQIIHDGGDSIESNNIEVGGSGASNCVQPDDETYTAGDDICEDDGSTDLTEDTIRVTWSSQGSSATLAEYEP